MAALAARVIPPFSSRGVYLLAAIIGGVFGLFMGSTESWAFSITQRLVAQSRLTQTQANVLALVLTIAGTLAPAIIVGLWLSCLSQRFKQTAVAAAIAGAAELLSGLFRAKFLSSADGGTDWHGWPPIGFLVNLAAFAVISTAAALLIRWLIRTLVFTTIEQDGTRCPRCGYALGSARIVTCPECGTPAEPRHLHFVRVHRTSAWLQRRARVLMGIFIVAMLIPLALAIQYRTIPALRFFSKFPDRSGDLFPLLVPRGAPGGSTNCVAAWVPFPSPLDRSRAIVVLYIPDQRSPLRAMRLAIAQAPGVVPSASVSGTPVLPGFQTNYGTPEIGADLPRDLAEQVIRDGIPPALIERLSHEADAAHWSPASTPTGWFTAGSGTQWIDPAPYFAAR